MAGEERSRPSVLLDMIVGKWLSQAICVVAELGIADLLKDGPRTSAEIVAAIDASEDAVYRLLRALAGAGLFTEGGGRTFALTSLGAALRLRPLRTRRFALALSGVHRALVPQPAVSIPKSAALLPFVKAGIHRIADFPLRFPARPSTTARFSRLHKIWIEVECVATAYCSS